MLSLRAKKITLSNINQILTEAYPATGKSLKLYNPFTHYISLIPFHVGYEQIFLVVSTILKHVVLL